MTIVTKEIENFIKQDVVKRFLKYVKINTTANEEEKTVPSSKGEWKLANLLVKELKEIGATEIELDKNCYLYATIKSSIKKAPAITLIAHLDTSPAEKGSSIKPIIHKNYDGKTITFGENSDLFLTAEECPELLQFLGTDIITSSGNTLLGADDKAGIAEIMTALSCIKKFGITEHPDIKIVFTPDEEIGRGTDDINLKRLGKVAYTIDGSIMGSIEDECFDAYLVTVSFKGLNVHPGYAKGKMVNAARIASKFVSELPENQTPENSEKREGFFHLQEINGNENSAIVKILLRDFDEANNIQRIDYIKQLLDILKNRYIGLKIEYKVKKQYKNMKEILSKYPMVITKAEKAIEMSGITPIKSYIRGGTDGARLTEKGIPTPNLFAGGMLFHSKKEWISTLAMQKSVETILNLLYLWAKEE